MCIRDRGRPGELTKQLTSLILSSAKQNIPRGKTAKVKPFWTPQLRDLKKARDQARIKVKNPKIVLM